MVFVPICIKKVL